MSKSRAEQKNALIAKIAADTAKMLRAGQRKAARIKRAKSIATSGTPPLMTMQRHSGVNPTVGQKKAAGSAAVPAQRDQNNTSKKQSEEGKTVAPDKTKAIAAAAAPRKTDDTSKAAPVATSPESRVKQTQSVATSDTPHRKATSSQQPASSNIVDLRPSSPSTPSPLMTVQRRGDTNPPVEQKKTAGSTAIPTQSSQENTHKAAPGKIDNKPTMTTLDPSAPQDNCKHSAKTSNTPVTATSTAAAADKTQPAKTPSKKLPAFAPLTTEREGDFNHDQQPNDQKPGLLAQLATTITTTASSVRDRVSPSEETVKREALRKEINSLLNEVSTIIAISKQLLEWQNDYTDETSCASYSPQVLDEKVRQKTGFSNHTILPHMIKLLQRQLDFINKKQGTLFSSDPDHSSRIASQWTGYHDLVKGLTPRLKESYDKFTLSEKETSHDTFDALISDAKNVAEKYKNLPAEYKNQADILKKESGATYSVLKNMQKKLAAKSDAEGNKLEDQLKQFQDSSLMSGHNYMDLYYELPEEIDEDIHCELTYIREEYKKADEKFVGTDNPRKNDELYQIEVKLEGVIGQIGIAKLAQRSKLELARKQIEGSSHFKSAFKINRRSDDGNKKQEVTASSPIHSPTQKLSDRRRIIQHDSLKHLSNKIDLLLTKKDGPRDYSFAKLDFGTILKECDSILNNIPDNEIPLRTKKNIREGIRVPLLGKIGGSQPQLMPESLRYNAASRVLRFREQIEHDGINNANPLDKFLYHHIEYREALNEGLHRINRAAKKLQALQEQGQILNPESDAQKIAEEEKTGVYKRLLGTMREALVNIRNAYEAQQDSLAKYNEYKAQVERAASAQRVAEGERKTSPSAAPIAIVPASQKSSSRWNWKKTAGLVFAGAAVTTLTVLTLGVPSVIAGGAAAAFAVLGSSVAKGIYVAIGIGITSTGLGKLLLAAVSTIRAPRSPASTNTPVLQQQELGTISHRPPVQVAAPSDARIAAPTTPSSRSRDYAASGTHSPRMHRSSRPTPQRTSAPHASGSVPDVKHTPVN